jgi:hypothetical protein
MFHKLCKQSPGRGGNKDAAESSPWYIPHLFDIQKRWPFMFLLALFPYNTYKTQHKKKYITSQSTNDIQYSIKF